MLTRLLDEHDVRCEFCNDEPALFRFGQYGKGIGENCIEAIQTISKGDLDEKGNGQQDAEQGHEERDGEERKEADADEEKRLQVSNGAGG